jgi:tetratricopeptide (TPR) repeat protein
LRQDIKKNPQDARAFFYLGNTARELAEWTYALWCYMEQLKFDKWHEQRFWGRIYAAQCLLQLGRTLEAKEMILASLHDDPVRAEPFVMLGDLAYAAQRWLEATHWYHIASSVPIPRDHRLFIQSPLYSGPGGGRIALDKEAMSRFHMRDYAGALRCQKLVQEIRDDARVRKNISEFEKALAKQEAKKAEAN